MKSKNTVKRLVILAILTTILFVQEQALSFIPNVQLTFLLLVLYATSFTLIENILIIIVHVILDNLVMGSFNFLFVPFMLAGYLVIPITIKTIFRKVKNPLLLALIGILYSLIYSWMFIIPNVFMLQVPFWTYLIADIPFEIILSLSSFLTILWLYKPLKDIIDIHILEYNIDEEQMEE